MVGRAPAQQRRNLYDVQRRNASWPADRARFTVAETRSKSVIDPLYVTSGFGVGLLVGMTGVGGGSLMTPLLILLFGVHPATAVGTALLYASATNARGSAVHGWARSIHSPAGMPLGRG